MELVKSGTNEVTIQGNIKTIDDYLAIKKMVTAIVDSGSRQVSLQLADSIAMTSSVIGYLVKLTNHDKIQVNIQVGDMRLYELLEELSLKDMFRVRYVGTKK